VRSGLQHNPGLDGVYVVTMYRRDCAGGRVLALR
jgi:hypothetical protein